MDDSEMTWGELRKYHLIALGGEIPAGGARLEVPGAIRLMRDIIRGRVSDPSRIEQECAKTRSGRPKLDLVVGRIISRVIALWQEEKHEEALQVANWADGKNPENPEIVCLIGRAYMKKLPPNPAQADIAFRKSHKLGCKRAELFALWYSAKESLQDWIGLIDVTRLADQAYANSDNAFIRARAYLTLGENAETSGNRLRLSNITVKGGKILILFFKGEARRIEFKN